MEASKIGWTDHTFNPWVGCQKVGPGCDHCYAEAWAKRSNIVTWGPHANRRRTTHGNWVRVLKWNQQAEQFHRLHGRRQRVFCASLSDVFDTAVPLEWFVDLLRWMHQTPGLDWLLLTKRIGNAHERLAMALDHLAAGLSVQTPGLTAWIAAWITGEVVPAHVWIGATVVNQEEADRDIPKLLKVPAQVRFLSIEPMLGPIDFYQTSASMPNKGHPWRNGPILQGIHWIIAGFESGPGFRPGDEAWLHSLRDQASAGGVSMFVKQLGGHPDKRAELEDLPDTLRIRQWPDVGVEPVTPATEER